jgi:diguanylate cyclase (GGDEF)-like protein
MARKMAAGYLLVTVFSLVAIVYALRSLHIATARSERLVSVDFTALNDYRDLRQNLLAQESLGKQYLILRDKTILELYDRRRQEFASLWHDLDALPLPAIKQQLAPKVTVYEERSATCRAFFDQKQWKKAEACLNQTAPLRNVLIKALDAQTVNRETILKKSMRAFSTDSRRAYRLTLMMAFIGIALSAPVSVTVIFSLHRSIKELVLATKRIAAGTFDHPINVDREDEFGYLAREFSEMGHKLQELERLRLDANPLTHLPGNRAIERALRERIERQVPFAHLYIDLDHFKAYGDRYGYRAGSDALILVGDLVRKAATEHGTPEDLVGHIGGDDFVVLTTPEAAEPIARALIEKFDAAVPRLYSAEDRQAGAFVAKDRYGVERRFPLLTISIAILRSETLDHPSPSAISRECAKMKERLKSLPGSNYLVNRRKKIGT